MSIHCALTLCDDVLSSWMKTATLCDTPHAHGDTPQSYYTMYPQCVWCFFQFGARFDEGATADVSRMRNRMTWTSTTANTTNSPTHPTPLRLRHRRPVVWATCKRRLSCAQTEYLRHTPVKRFCLTMDLSRIFRQHNWRSVVTSVNFESTLSQAFSMDVCLLLLMWHGT